MLINFLGFISVWILEAAGAALQRPAEHRVDLSPENRSALWRSKTSIPLHLSLSRAVVQQHTQGLDTRKACTQGHTSLHLCKSSRNQARQATCCSPALACASQSIPECDGASSTLPTNHRGLGWQKSYGLPALQVNVLQHQLCRPLAVLQSSRIDD